MGLKTESYKPDDKDALLLRALQQNARLTNKELAAKVHLPPLRLLNAYAVLSNLAL